MLTLRSARTSGDSIRSAHRHGASRAWPVRYEVSRSPIAERGWFITVTHSDGTRTTGWIGRHFRVHLHKEKAD
jgi:hypothetical protein